MKTILFLSLIFVIQTAFPGTYYMSPNGTGDGSSAGSPVGTFSAGMGLVSAGDTLVLLDGEYTQSLNVSKSGARDAHIVIKAGNVGGAFINGENVRIPITIWQKSWIHFDGIKAGNSNEHVYHLLYADHLKITRCAGFNAGGAKDPDANFHIFEIAYSDSAFAEDIWGWGTGRYTCTFYGCSNSHIRRGLFRPGLYSRCPHAGLAIYCTDHTLTENVIVFESRVDPTSTYGGTEPWKLITGGFVCEGHDCPNTKSSKDNRHYGCIAIDNGEHWDVTPRSQPAGCFVWNEFQGEFQDWVLWKNADKGFANFTDTFVAPTRCLEGDPSNIVSNTNPNILKRYEDGIITNQDLWPWPYEDIIKTDMGMSETITEYVRRQLDPYIVIPQASVEHREIKNLSVNGDLNVSPNPFTTSVKMQVLEWDYAPAAQFSDLEFKIFDINGKQVYASHVASAAGGSHVWDAANQPGGIYIINAQSGNQILSKKVVLHR
jgi:hypothetical protein